MHALRSIATLSGNLDRLNIALAALEARDPHLALGITGRRLQQEIDATRAEIARARDAIVLNRLVNKVA